jgi:hypothetical protein
LSIFSTSTVELARRGPHDLFWGQTNEDLVSIALDFARLLRKLGYYPNYLKRGI